MVLSYCIKNVIIVGHLCSKELIFNNYDVVIDDNQFCIQSAINVRVPNIYMISNNDVKYNFAYIKEFEEKGVKVVSSFKDINF